MISLSVLWYFCQIINMAHEIDEINICESNFAYLFSGLSHAAQIINKHRLMYIILLVFRLFLFFFHSPTNVCTTVMRFVVRVPVLSEQIAVALPMVSHASRWRTRLLSFIIFFIFDDDQEQRNGYLKEIRTQTFSFKIFLQEFLLYM